MLFYLNGQSSVGLETDIFINSFVASEVLGWTVQKVEICFWS